MTAGREWIAQVTPAGHLPGHVRRELDDLVRSLAGKRVVVKLWLYQKQRSSNQNRYMFGVVVKMITDAFREAGNNVDAEDVFAFLKMEVWKITQVFVTPDGEVLKGLGSSRHWTTQEMEARLEQARAWAAQTLGIGIPLPHEEIEQPNGKESA
jgi:hypothetical protein